MYPAWGWDRLQCNPGDCLSAVVPMGLHESVPAKLLMQIQGGWGRPTGLESGMAMDLAYVGWSSTVPPSLVSPPMVPSSPAFPNPVPPILPIPIPLSQPPSVNMKRLGSIQRLLRIAVSLTYLQGSWHENG